MVPTRTFAVRETLILILFGIILVPIAAKRAQDARGYRWQLQHHAAAPAAAASGNNNININNPNSNDPLASAATDTYLVTAPPILHVALLHQPQNETLEQQQQAPSTGAAVPPPPPPPSSPRAIGAVTTIRFGAAALLATGEGPVMATAAPTTIPGASLRVVDAKAAEEEGSVARLTTTTATSAAKASDASSKGRWTLIWMGSAIAAVAGLMSLC